MNQENLPDEEYNRKSVLLMLITMILRCSPVCEKQALFAVFQCVKENGLEPHLVRKVWESTQLKTLNEHAGLKKTSNTFQRISVLLRFEPIKMSMVLWFCIKWL